MKTWNPNVNHPKLGSSVKVDPIREEKDIKAIKRFLGNKPRDLLLFTLGVNNGLRTGDLLRLKVGQVRYVKPGEYITITESKTKKENVLMLNNAAHRALTEYLEKVTPDDQDYLFASKKGGGAITIQRANALVKEWTNSINLRGNFGAHSLRKTFGFVQRTKFGVGIEVLMKRFNHSRPAVTMCYLGIADKEVNHILLNEI